MKGEVYQDGVVLLDSRCRDEMHRWRAPIGQRACQSRHSMSSRRLDSETALFRTEDVLKSRPGGTSPACALTELKWIPYLFVDVQRKVLNHLNGLLDILHAHGHGLLLNVFKRLINFALVLREIWVDKGLIEIYRALNSNKWRLTRMNGCLRVSLDYIVTENQRVDVRQ